MHINWLLKNTDILFLVFFTFGLYEGVQNYICVQKKYAFASFVCVCNATFCDSLGELKIPEPGKVLVVKSSRDQYRWDTSEVKFKDAVTADVKISLDHEQRGQRILGFGGAFTDATGVNLLTVPKALRKAIIKGYFDKEGLEYNMARVPIGGTDFSTHPYTYDDLPPGQVDEDLKYFKLTKEDYLYKIPFIKEAKRLAMKRGVDMKLVSSPWSGPGWMKDNARINGNGMLKRRFYDSWAKYIIRFLEEYKKNDIDFYGLTTQNEPTAGLGFDYGFNQMAWRAQDQGAWIGNNLGPILQKSQFKNVSIFGLDDQRFLLPSWIKNMFQNSNASKYITGIAVHWYYDFVSPNNLLSYTHSLYPSLPILYTEASNGWAPWDLKKVILGSWTRAEEYASDIIQNLQHWVVGWIDWNLVLDMEGGPNWVKNFVDSPVIINKEKIEAYIQPMYFALAHFSKSLPRGSTRLGHRMETASSQVRVEMVAFRRPDEAIVLILLNRSKTKLTAAIWDNKKTFQIDLEARSLVTLLWSN